MKIKLFKKIPINLIRINKTMGLKSSIPDWGNIRLIGSNIGSKILAVNSLAG